MNGDYAGMGMGCVYECNTRKDLVGTAKEWSFIKSWPKGQLEQPAGFHLYAKWKQPVSLPFLPQLTSHQGLSGEKLSLYRAQYIAWTTQDEVFETLSPGTESFHYGR